MKKEKNFYILKDLKFDMLSKITLKSIIKRKLLYRIISHPTSIENKIIDDVKNTSRDCIT